MVLPAPLPPRDRLLRLVRGPRRLHILIGGGVLALLVAYPFLGGWAGARLLAGRLRAQGLEAQVARARAGLGLTLSGLVVRVPGRAPLATVERLEVPFAAAWGGGTVRVRAPRLTVTRGGPDDNVAPLLERRRAGGGGPGAGGGRRLPAVVLEEGTVRVEDLVAGRTLLVGAVAGTLEPGRRLAVEAQQISGQVRLGGGESDPAFGAASIEVEGRLEGLRPVPWPSVRIEGGYVRALPTLPLTGIVGTLEPEPAAGGGPPRLQVRLEGSYGGSKRTLWTASGALRPVGGGLDGALALKAERFSLDKLADVLPQSILQPQDTSLDAALDLRLAPDRIAFAGSLEVTGLNIHHEKLSSEPVFDLGFALRVDGAVDPRRRRLELNVFEGRLRDLVGRVSGAIELAPGKFAYKDGAALAALPKIELRVTVPRLSCAKLLQSIPGPFVAHLQGFTMQGQFEADIRTKIDYANLDALELGGKVGIDGCRVTGAPEEVQRLAGPEPIVQTVEVPPLPGDTSSDKDTLTFEIGPSNPDFVPYDKISPHLVNSIMTTEDNGFFKHRGFVTREFPAALRRNILAGGFRYGASSITMQMVKNVLLAHEKTLSRKLQEMFLVWYVEQNLPKERILELYFNAIEFGPRLYGIGPAARHYFGKAPSDLTPLEAAFFSSILPSPKRRYVQYCYGQLKPQWDKYVRRILAKVHERGRLTPEEYQANATAPFVFDGAERTLTEKQCLEWVKRITARPEPEPVPDAE